MRRIIRALTFELDSSVSVEYVTPNIDHRESGLVLNHAMFIPGDHAELEDERIALVAAAHKLLDVALTQFADEREADLSLPPSQVPSGPFDNPADEALYGPNE